MIPSMDNPHEGTLHGRFNPGRPRTLSCLDDVGADVQLRARFADLANEDVYATKGDPVPVLDGAALGAPACVVELDLAATTLSQPAHGVYFELFETALQESET